ncbi:putative metal-binding motif-containing protein [Kangiella marina]|uniref:Uncharacterized protein n=1 Tax=Kangiella marina TaxID=1079178 RepID=A0ABP8IBP6_9GAMM
MNRKLLLVYGLAIAGLLCFSPESAQSAEEIKGQRIQSTNSIKTINPKALKDIKKVGQVKMLSNAEYQKKLKQHNLRVKSNAKGVNVNAQANTRLKSQNKEFDENKYDCDDNQRGVNPGAQEVCDGIDNNCDGDVDMINGRRLNFPFYLDADADLYGDPSKVYYACSVPPGYSARNDDCNDKSVSVNPGKEEIPGNGIDENCDGRD